MESANVAAAWISAVITSVGLGSLILQVGAFQKLLDPFHENRGSHYLGLWGERNSTSRSLFPFKKPAPRGPKIEGGYSDGLCSLRIVHVSRKPLGTIGTASWTSLLATLNPNPQLQPVYPRNVTEKRGNALVLDMEGVISEAPLELPWDYRLDTQELVTHRDRACTKITRTAFVTCLVLVNAYQIYKYSGAAGLRVAYAGYTGTWQVHWPLGGPAELEYLPLDSHNKPQETYPPSSSRRVNKCLLMLLGIIETSALEKLAFPEPQAEGVAILKLHQRGYPCHGQNTHLFNMMGGNCSDVDYLLRRSVFGDEAAKVEEMLELSVPNPKVDLDRKPIKSWDKRKHSSTVLVPPHEQAVLARALDCLPWSSLGWSVHRGMQSLLVAYGERIMKAYRPALARTLKDAIDSHPERLEAVGWSSKLVRDDMGYIAAASVMANGGDSGDTVRVVTAAAELLWDGTAEELDETLFWRDQVREPLSDELPASTYLAPGVVVALTKLFVLEWSNELDHRLYLDLPLWMLVV